MSEITSIWQKIEAWYAGQGAADLLNAPASETDIAAAEAQIGVTFPDELRESLLRHDGTKEGGWRYGTLLSVAGICSEEKVWRELLENGTFDDNADHDASEGNDATQTGWWVAGWIPLDADGAGNGSVIDVVPGPAGTAGQVLDMDHEVGPSGPEFDSLAEYLESVLDDLESGDYVFHDGGIYDAIDVEDDEEE